MSGLSRAAAAAGHAAARLLPAGRRDWIEAVWAEAYEVPPGLHRLAWRAGGLWMVAREVLMPRRLVKVVLFTVAAAAAAWLAWPQPGVGHALIGRVGVIVTVLLLAGLPSLARRIFGPASASRAGRAARVLCCAAILALIPARVIVEVFADLTPRQDDYLRVYDIYNGTGVPGASSGGPPWPGEIMILLVIAGYVAALLWMSSQRSELSRSTLAIGLGTGLPLGLVMYAVAPLGLGLSATNPWLPGSDVDPLVALAWLLLLGGPAAAAVLAARSCHDADGSVPYPGAAIRQGIAAGVLANLTGALLVTTLGTSTTALMLKSGALRAWLYSGQHLSPLALYHQEVYDSTGTEVYVAMCVAFPVIGLIMGAIGVAGLKPREAYADDGGELVLVRRP
ncbi:MAG TPA: hypothetical protein VGI96_50425 [Streptosporangiaceae bacterium]|jgi:hypothetical protein